MCFLKHKSHDVTLPLTALQCPLWSKRPSLMPSRWHTGPTDGLPPDPHLSGFDSFSGRTRLKGAPPQRPPGSVRGDWGRASRLRSLPRPVPPLRSRTSAQGKRTCTILRTPAQGRPRRLYSARLETGNDPDVHGQTDAAADGDAARRCLLLARGGADRGHRGGEASRSLGGVREARRVSHGPVRPAA